MYEYISRTLHIQSYILYITSTIPHFPYRIVRGCVLGGVPKYLYSTLLEIKVLVKPLTFKCLIIIDTVAHALTFC